MHPRFVLGQGSSLEAVYSLHPVGVRNVRSGYRNRPFYGSAISARNRLTATRCPGFKTSPLQNASNSWSAKFSIANPFSRSKAIVVSRARRSNDANNKAAGLSSTTTGVVENLFTYHDALCWGGMSVEPPVAQSVSRFMVSPYVIVSSGVGSRIESLNEIRGTPPARSGPFNQLHRSRTSVVNPA